MPSASPSARKARLTSAQRHAKRSAEYWERNGALEYAKDRNCNLVAPEVSHSFSVYYQNLSQAATRRTVTKKLDEFDHTWPWHAMTFHFSTSSIIHLSPQDFISSHVCSTQLAPMWPSWPSWPQCVTWLYPRRVARLLACQRSAQEALGNPCAANFYVVSSWKTWLKTWFELLMA